MMCLLLVFLVVELNSDSYISAVPKASDSYISAVPKTSDSYISAVPKRTDSYISAVPKEGHHHGIVLPKQRFRHKHLAFNDITEDDDVSDTTEDDKEVIIGPQALPVRANRSKSTLDKLVREPELGRQNIYPFKIPNNYFETCLYAMFNVVKLVIICKVGSLY